MAVNEQDKITVPFASSGLRNEIPETATGSNLASMQEGFPAVTMTDIASGGQPPDGKDFNGILNVITKILQYAQSGGIYKYDQSYASAVGGYPLGAVLRSATGAKIWVNTSENNATDPDNGGSGWLELVNAPALTSAISAVEGLISAEATARANAVSAEATARANAVSAEATARENAVSAEATARANADTALGQRIDGKQDILHFDSAPISSSSNPVTSGGVYGAINAIVKIPDMSGKDGQFMSTDGSVPQWVSLGDVYLPLVGGNFIPLNKLLTLGIGNDSGIRIQTNPTGLASDGASLQLYGKNHATYAGRFYLRASDGTSSPTLTGLPDKSLTWDSNDVLCENNFSASGYGGKLRLTNGMIFQWGAVTASGSSATTTKATLPVAMADTSYVAIAGYYSSSDNMYGQVTARTTTQITIKTYGGKISPWFVIGRPAP